MKKKTKKTNKKQKTKQNKTKKSEKNKLLSNDWSKIIKTFSFLPVLPNSVYCYRSYKNPDEVRVALFMWILRCSPLR